MKKTVLWMVVVVAGMQVQAADVFIDENFDSRKTGEVKSNRNIDASHYSLGDRECALEVVDASSSPADPFGGTDNKSLRLTDFSEVSSGVYAMWTSRKKVRQGRISVDFFVADHDEGVLWVSGRNGASIGPLLRVYKGELYLYDSEKLIKLDNECAAEMKHSVVMDFDAKKGTFSGTLDGTAFSQGEKTEFEFYQKISMLYLVRVETSGGSTWQGDSYVDNVKLTLIPE